LTVDSLQWIVDSSFYRRLAITIAKPFGYRPTQQPVLLGFVTSTQPTI